MARKFGELILTLLWVAILTVFLYWSATWANDLFEAVFP